MKSLFTLLLTVFALTSIWAQDTQSPEGPAITFEEESYDFGDIYQGDEVVHVFKFENSGTQPLIITNVQTTCGCTATDWPRDPVLPGQSASITVKFNSAGKYGRQNKVITVVSNAVSPLNQVIITTNVLPKKDSN